MAVDLAQKAQNFTNRGRQALETGRYDLAVDMLMEAVAAAPDVLETRRLLRTAQIANFRKNGKAGFGAKLGYMLARQKILGRIIKWTAADGSSYSCLSWFYKNVCVAIVGENNQVSSLMFALCYVVVFTAMAMVLYRKRIIIKL